MNNIEIINTSQELFDSFNTFILSDDTKVFNKLIARTIIYNQVKDIPGDIVECGVFKGTGIYTFLKLKRIFNDVFMHLNPLASIKTRTIDSSFKICSVTFSISMSYLTRPALENGPGGIAPRTIIFAKVLCLSKTLITRTSMFLYFFLTSVKRE